MQLQLDNTVRDFLNNGEFSRDIVGLMIGSHSASTIKLYYLAETKDEDKTDSSFTPSTIRSSLLSHHTRQLLRMLPGGLTILGLYTISTEKSDVESIKKCLRNLQKNLSKFPYSSETKIFLHFDSRTKKFDCLCLNGEKEEKMEVVIEDCEMVKIETDFELSGVLQQSLEKKVKDGIDLVCGVWEEALETSVVLFNGEFPSADKVYKETDKISILIDKLPSLFLKDKEEFINNLSLHGKMRLIAYVNKGESTQQARKNLLQDFHRTLFSRLQMHCDSLVDEDSSNVSEQTLHEIPRRVFVKLVKNVLVSDYLFPGEGGNECAASLEDVLGLSIEEGGLNVVEPEFDIELLNEGSMEEIFERAESLSKITEKEGFFTIWGVGVLGVGVALLAILLYFIK